MLMGGIEDHMIPGQLARDIRESTSCTAFSFPLLSFRQPLAFPVYVCVVCYSKTGRNKVTFFEFQLHVFRFASKANQKWSHALGIRWKRPRGKAIQENIGLQLLCPLFPLWFRRRLFCERAFED